IHIRNKPVRQLLPERLISHVSPGQLNFSFESLIALMKTRSKRRRRRSIIAFEMIRLDRTSREPLHQQLYRQVRDELAAGSFGKDSSRLPSTRALAADLGIARLTVKLAFEKLHAEGY